jgi:Methyltransferase domain
LDEPPSANASRGPGAGVGARLGAASARALARWNGLYALGVYLPASQAARRLRDRGRALRGVRRDGANATRLPQVAWNDVLAHGAIQLAETGKRDGNVNLAELAVLAQAAAAIAPGTAIIEIGTFDGRTTLNLAVNAPAQSPVFTLDLPPDDVAAYALAPGERQYVDKPRPGARFRAAVPPWAAAAQRITQLHGDSATFDWSPYEGKAGLVFVDGSHAYDYVRKDSETALRLIAKDGSKGGAVLWHDYGRWEGVTRALDELEAERGLGLRHVRGTSLVFWRM